MKKLNKFFAGIFFGGIIFSCLSCGYSINYTPSELTLVKSFNQTHTYVYKSEQEQFDTITFSKLKRDTIERRGFETGNYNIYALSVYYQISKNSYHKLIGASENEYLINFSRAKPYTSKEIGFLGLLFDEGFVDSVIAHKYRVIVFPINKAEDHGININKGIKSFTMNLDSGIVSFIDEHNIKWTRQ